MGFSQFYVVFFLCLLMVELLILPLNLVATFVIKALCFMIVFFLIKGVASTIFSIFFHHEASSSSTAATSSSPSAAAAASSNSCSTEGKYDVFISFRGEDTRNGFTSHLYDALCRKQIKTFIDYGLNRGDEISPALLKAIEESNLSIVILSPDYASSSWCLDELLKIVERKNTKGQIIIPVFYNVTPSDVRKQSGSFSQAFAKHDCKQFKKTKDKLQRWRAALTEVANLSGWPLHGPESELIKKIIDDVIKKLNRRSSSDLDGLVGIEACMKSVDSLLCIKSLDVRVVGIWGMGGIGKTTLARAIYDRMTNQFEGCCFLANVREEWAKHGKNRLQESFLFKIFEDENLNSSAPNIGLTFSKNRLRRKKVLIVLDDVDSSQQLEFLIEDYSWFGPGSRIIITSRDKQVLKNGVHEIYELKGLNYHEALQLFSLSAFKQNHPTIDYMELAQQVVSYAQGIPLALKVLGRFLFDRSKEDWGSALNKLKNCPKEIQDVLKISYDGLDDEEKEIFLDIACFFKGGNKDRVISILDSKSNGSTSIGISVLIDKCLVTIGVFNNLCMHDLIQEVGHNIVRKESIKEPGKRSRLWDPQDIGNLFKKNTGTEVVESISLDMSEISPLHLTSDAFTRMPKLRFLKFYCSSHPGFLRENCKLHLSEGLESLPDELMYLYWSPYTLKSMPAKVNAEVLVELHLPNSNLEYLWKEKQNLVNLKRINLRCSRHLIEIPDLSLAISLEVIDLDYCPSLTSFPAIKCLKKLVWLRMRACRRLKNLPSTIHNFTSLKHLDLIECSNITKFPDVPRDIEMLHFIATAIEEVPSSVECLTKLKMLYLDRCRMLRSVHNNILKLKSLQYISLLGCSNLNAFPEFLETNEMLETLDLGATTRKELPSSTCRLSRASKLDMGYSKNSTSFPNSICDLQYITALDLRECNIESLSLKPFYLLQRLDIGRCKKLRSLQDFPFRSCLNWLQAQGCISLETLPVSMTMAYKEPSHGGRNQYFTFASCLKLDEIARRNIEANARLRIQVVAANAPKPQLKNYGDTICCCFPGSEIAGWCSNENEGSSITMELPPNWCTSNFLGFAMCIVVAFEDYSWNGYSPCSVECSCAFETNDGDSNYIDCSVRCFGYDDETIDIGSDHVFILYDHELQTNLSSIHQSCRKASFKFEFMGASKVLPNCTVKKCGVCPLYSEEEEEECTEISNEA